MPSGKVHVALTVSVISGVIAPYALVNLGGSEYPYIAGCLTGILVTPDLDLNNDMYSHYLIRKTFYPLYVLWRMFWKPYNLIVPHRHFISHFPILGTILRIGYVFLILNILNLFLFYILRMFDTVSFIWLWNWSFFFGLCHVDTIHWIVDNTIKGKETTEGE